MGVTSLLQMAVAATVITLAMAAPAPTLTPSASATCADGPSATIANLDLPYVTNARPADSNNTIINMDWIIAHSVGRFHYEPEVYPGFTDEHCQLMCFQHLGCVAYAVVATGTCEYFGALIEPAALIPSTSIIVNSKNYRMYNMRCGSTSYGYDNPFSRREDTPQPTGPGANCVEGTPADNGPLYPIYGYQDARPDNKSKYVLDHTFVMKHVIGNLGMSGGGPYVAMKCQYSCNAASGCVAYGVDSRNDCKFFDAIIDPAFLVPALGNDTYDYGNYNKLCPPPAQLSPSVEEPPSSCVKGAPAVAPEDDPDHTITDYTDAAPLDEVNATHLELDADWAKEHQIGQQKFAMAVAGNGPYVAFICQTYCTEMEGCLAYSVSLDALVGCRFFNQIMQPTKLCPSDDSKNYGNYNKRCLVNRPGLQPPGFEARD